MIKIWIAGSAGSGKTTLAYFTNEKLNIPVYHGDHITLDIETDKMRSGNEQIVLKISQNKWGRFSRPYATNGLSKPSVAFYLSKINNSFGANRRNKHNKHKQNYFRNSSPNCTYSIYM